ncbi:hypothetical protein AN0795.2 [Paecilomyces variotii No. 5]|uniref:COX assembly mitochondrial protein n=1 Tax=Byssochlamys spectabilis (strain No. 5 / NBRC 109023) TaxID=1356009 RepID=V5I4T0_BYSSN|nr:hypothetical protein AN0795.2 [Paecilomyces variotii No. 5]
MATASTSSSSPGPQLNLRNPVPLSAAQEQQVKELYHKRVSQEMMQGHWLTHPSAEFAQCAVNRTVTATWICRQQRLAMNACMLEHAKPEEEDRAREEWFLKREERRHDEGGSGKEEEVERAGIAAEEMSSAMITIRQIVPLAFDAPFRPRAQVQDQIADRRSVSGGFIVETAVAIWPAVIGDFTSSIQTLRSPESW